MTILSSQSIRRRLTAGMLAPWCERTTHDETGLSFGIGPASYDLRLAQALEMPGPGSFALASTLERWSVPDDLAVHVRDKSSLVRRGLAVFNTHVDPGFRGWLTLELVYHGTGRLRLPAGAPIAQAVFELLDEPTEQPYAGRYQDQPAGPQEPR